MTDAERIAAGLTEAQRRVLTHDRFDPNGWEPNDPSSILCNNLVALGLFRRADGRCMFERFKDSFIVPTETGLAVRAILMEGQG